MKKETHPTYGAVIFRDVSCGEQWIGASTKLDGPRETIDGVEYPVVALEISSFSHPFYSGRKSFVDSAGRVEKFNKRFGGGVMSKKAQKKAAAETEQA
jgi:large subunit ribosomal protein L31